MIAQLHGLLAGKTVEQAIVDVHGVGYQVAIPLSTYYTLPDVQEPVTLCTTMYVREDAIRLYGFATAAERSVFELLISVSSIGPRLALNMLSSIAAPELQQAIAHAEVSRLQSIPGIGRKTAERVILELQEKMTLLDTQPTWQAPVATKASEHMVNDVLSALLNLGYKHSEAEKATRAAHAAAEGDLLLEMLLKDALQRLAR